MTIENLGILFLQEDQKMSHLLLFSASLVLVEWYAFPHKNCQVLQRVYWRMHCPLSSFLISLMHVRICIVVVATLVVPLKC